MDVLNITTHCGKMTDIRSISTSTKLNERCRENAKIKGSICEHCYAEALCNLRPSLSKALERNTHLLRSGPLLPEQIPDVSPDEIFRFEAFGDLNNYQQLENYVTIAKANPKTVFALYTKCYDWIKYYFDAFDPPKNLVIVLSSLMVNTPLDPEKVLGSTYAKFAPSQIKIFTVYTKEYLKKHPEVSINCGSRSCFKCRKCYNPNNGIVHMSEILKSDQTIVERWINWDKPEFRAKAATQIEDIMNMEV